MGQKPWLIVHLLPDPAEPGYARNDRKGSRTPKEAGMTLLRKPFRPSSLPVKPALHDPCSVMPQVWLPYCSGLGSERVA